MKVKIQNLSDAARIEILDTLYTAAASVKGREAMKNFLRDVLTESERIMVGRRLVIARLLLGQATYEKINKELGVGYDTIQRVERWLEDQMPGYEEAIAGLEEELVKREEKLLLKTSAIARLKKKYPLHFLLFPSPQIKKKERSPWRKTL